jgi:hypothetical protein
VRNNADSNPIRTAIARIYIRKSNVIPFIELVHRRQTRNTHNNACRAHKKTAN